MYSKMPTEKYLGGLGGQLFNIFIPENVNTMRWCGENPMTCVVSVSDVRYNIIKDNCLVMTCMQVNCVK